MVAAAEAEAERNHWRGVIAVADDGGRIILLAKVGFPLTQSIRARVTKVRNGATPVAADIHR
jgi:hypothetical protein